MNITAEFSDLLTALSAVVPACSTSTTIPALRNIKATAADDTLTLTANDPSTGILIRASCPASVLTSGTAIILRDKFAAILKESASTVAIRSTSTALAITCNGASYTLPHIPTDEFPDLDLPNSASHSIQASDLRRLINLTLFAADKNQTAARFALQAIHFTNDAGSLRLSATDSKRLASASAPATLSEFPSHPILIPAASLKLLERTLSDSDTINFHFTNSAAIFSGPTFTLHATLTQGKFPDTPKAFREAQKGQTSLTLPTEDFHSAVRRAAICSDDESKRIDLAFTPSLLTLRARGAASGASEVQLPIEYDSEPLKIEFNPQYISDYLRAIDSDTFTLTLKSSNAPGLFACDGGMCLIMPLTGS